MAGYRNRYDVYDIEKGEFILKNANSGEVEKAIGLPSTKISTYASKEYIFNKRYRTIPKSIPTQKVKINRTPEVKRVMEEWDRIRQKPKLWHTIKNSALGDYAKKFNESRR